MIGGLALSAIGLGLLFLNWRKNRDFLSVALMAAFALRLFSAFLMEFTPFFPEKYYTDSVWYHEAASSIAASWRALRPSDMTGSFGHLNYSRILAAFYFVFGSSMFVARVLNSFIGALTLIPAWKIAERLGGQKAAKTTVVLYAVWPSAIYFSMEIFREASITFLFLWAVYFSLRFLSETRWPALLLSLLLSAVAGLLRPEMMVFSAFGLLLIVVFGLRKKKASALYLVAPMAVLLLLAWHFSTQFPFFKQENDVLQLDGAYKILNDLKEGKIKDQSVYPETALFEGVKFKGWLDVFKFLPTGIFHILFMPLPGLYPLGGNPSRVLSAGENLLLLALTVVAIKNFILCRKGLEAWYVVLLLLFIFSILAPVEPDLGSAMRHKITFLPMIFCFVFRPRLQ